ncbi:MAG: NFACT family protein, partial [Thermoplasmata archaeon]|nr:NFACT family protein [Thermoplasmata archaeon]
MKTQMSNFDISAFVRESQHYVGMQVEKIFQMSFTEVWLRLSRKGEKATLVVKLGRAMWFEEGNLKSDVPPPNFAMLLRKHIAGKKLNTISQHNFDRIVVLEFGTDNQFKLIIEMFGKGNMVLVLDGVIIKPLTSRSWRHREMKPGAVYKFPPEGINPLDLEREDVSEIISGSDRDVVRTIATQLNMGGSYAEELCDFLSIDKDAKASDMESGL